jgi:transposase
MLGIDVSKQTLACTLLNPANRQVDWFRQVPNTPAGVQSLLEAVAPDTPWVLEPTGRYSLVVAKPAKDAGRCVLLAPSKRAKRFAASLSNRAKTDRLDSRSLALFALAQDLPAYPIKSERVEQLDQLLSARKSLLLSLSALEQQASELPYAKEALTGAVASLKAERDKLDGQIATLTKDQTTYPSVARLRAVPGIGPVTAAALGSCLQARSFTHSDQVVAYIGLDIQTVQSGRRQGNKGLSKQGDAELRRLLFNCARAAVQAKDSPFKEQYERELKKHLSKTAASCAVARKLARLCWSLVRHQTEYDPQRVFTQPKKNRSEEKPLDNQT